MVATFLFALLWFASLSKAVGAGLGHGGGIIRKECQSFTNHGHDKTPPTVFNPLSLWLTLPRDMGVSHTLWPPSITRAIPACLRFAQGLHKAQKIKTTEPLYNVLGDSMYSILSIDAILTLTYFFNITKVHKTSIIIIPKCTKHKKHQFLNKSSSVTTLWTSLEYSLVASPSDAIIVRCKAALVFTVSRKSSIRSNIS